MYFLDNISKITGIISLMLLPSILEILIPDSELPNYTKIIVKDNSMYDDWLDENGYY